MLIADNRPLCFDNTPACNAICSAFCGDGVIADDDYDNNLGCQCFLPYMAGGSAVRCALCGSPAHGLAHSRRMQWRRRGDV